MSSVKNLKKDINSVYGELIEAVYLRELLKPKGSKDNSEEIVNQIIASFDSLIEKLNQKNIENKKAHFRAVAKEFKSSTEELVNSINTL